MKNKTFKCPYLTKEDKEFLKYEQKVYKQNFDMLLKFHKKHEELLKRTDDEAENYDNASYSALCFDVGSDVFYALTLTHVHFVDDICNYFSTTRGIKELNNEELTMEEVANETKMLMLDEVFDKYVRKYLEEKIIKEKEFEITMSEKAKKQNNDIKAGMLEKPIIRRVDTILRYTEDGAFDIPAMTTDVAIDYFSCNISFEDAKMELYQGGHLMGGESDEYILKYLKKSLKGNERFYEFIQPEGKK